MKFEEEFPSLEGATCNKCDYPHPAVHTDVILEHCLDKEKVRDAIDDIIPPHCKCDDLCKSCGDDNANLKKELGLENED